VLFGARPEHPRHTVTPARGLVLVRPIETPDSLPGSPIVLTEKTRTDWTAGQMEVVAIGAPSICEDVDCERPHDQAHYAEGLPREHRRPCGEGDWVLMRHRSLIETHQDGLYAAHQDDVLAVLNS